MYSCPLIVMMTVFEPEFDTSSAPPPAEWLLDCGLDDDEDGLLLFSYLFLDEDRPRSRE